MHFLVVRLGAGDHGGRVGEERRDLPRVIVGVVGKLDAISCDQQVVALVYPPGPSSPQPRALPRCIL
eukprot:1175785-Prorocentrum_minimum.AAC.2